MNEKWPTPRDFWKSRSVMVTGGAGFLGSFVVEKLKQRGARDIIITQIEEYNLVDPQAIQRLFDNVAASGSRSGLSNIIIIHLVAQVGGIGANRDHPAEFFFITI